MKMKLQIIETPEYILAVSNEEIKDGDCCIDMNGKIFIHENHFPISIGQRKIIAYQPKGNTLELDLPLLPGMVVEDDVENQKWYKDAISVLKDEHSIRIAKICLKAGHRAATKVYSEDDLRKALSESFKASEEGYNITADEIIQSLKQHKTPKWFVAEMERVKDWDKRDINGDYEAKLQLKTTTINGGTYLVGTYLYE